MIVKYRRRGGHRPPPDRETLDIDDDGSFSMWRSVPPAPLPAGRFQGTLSGEDAEALAAEAAAAAAAGGLEVLPKPGAAIETYEVAGAKAKLGHHDEPEGPWGQLIEHVRDLSEDLTDQPRAAISVEVEPGGSAARLVHLGDEPLRLDLRDLSVRAVQWEQHQPAGDWRSAEGHPGPSAQLTAEPGWRLDLPFDHGFSAAEGREIVAYVTLGAFDDDVAVHLSLTSRRVPA